MKNILVDVVDDHRLFRSTLSKFLSDVSRIGRVREASDGKELFALLAKENLPDVVLLDIQMPVMDGFTCCRKLAAEYPEIKIIVLSGYVEESYVQQLMQLNAHVFLPKNVNPDELIEAIYTICDTGCYQNELTTKVLKVRGHSLRAAGRPIATIDLSKREQIIVQMLCRQLTNRQIGGELSLSENTIRNHKVRIMRKVGARNTSGLVIYAIEHGLFHSAQVFD